MTSAEQAAKAEASPALDRGSLFAPMTNAAGAADPAMPHLGVRDTMAER